MADERKRIINLTDTDSVTTGDYIAMDSVDGGTKKIPASHFMGGPGRTMWGGIQGDIAQQADLASVLNNLIYVNADGEFYVNSEDEN